MCKIRSGNSSVWVAPSNKINRLMRLKWTIKIDGKCGGFSVGDVCQFFHPPPPSLPPFPFSEFSPPHRSQFRTTIANFPRQLYTRRANIPWRNWGEVGRMSSLLQFSRGSVRPFRDNDGWAARLVTATLRMAFGPPCTS